MKIRSMEPQRHRVTESSKMIESRLSNKCFLSVSVPLCLIASGRNQILNFREVNHGNVI